MKKTFKMFLSKCLAVTMAASLLIPAWPGSQAKAREELVNVAPDATASTANSSYGSAVSAVNDGDDATAWQTPGEWPTAVELNLNGNHNVSKVVVKLGGAAGEDYRTLNVKVQYAQNGVTDTPIAFGSTEGKMSKDAEVAVEAPVSASHIYVELSDPKDPNVAQAGFWPAIREIEVYETQDVKLSEYNNIASQATITTDGDNPANPEYLTDENASTLYKFHNAQQTEEKYVDLDFGGERSIDALSIAFEHVDSEPYSYQFTYSISGKPASGGDDVTLADHVTANRTDHSYQEYKFTEALYTNIRILIHSTTNVVGGNPGNGWPAIAEFEVYGSEEEVGDAESIAWKKPVHTASGKTQAGNVNDGSKNTAWRGDYYPAYVDIDLEENYNLDTVEVYTPSSGYSQYSIYTSLDGRDFAKLTEKTSTASADAELGEVYPAEGTEARIIRVYLEYNSASSQAVINEIRATGTISGTPVQQTPAVNTAAYTDSSYHVPVSAQDTYDEVYGIIARRLGENYKSWFTFSLAENPKNTGYDYFQLEDQNGKIHISGNSGVSMAMGLNHYLKYYCQVNLAQTGDQAKMPEAPKAVGTPCFQETKVSTRYSYNYCTLSYSMAFWGQQEWREELDWLALNGVNVVLDATGQEEVWRRFLTELGYNHAETKDYIAGPAYYAWAYMANLSGFGGPVHDSWFEERTELARKNQLIMRRLGMQPVLQGYSGMVPNDIKDHDPDAEVIRQGTWCSFQRPDMLVTTSATFDEYAALFYQCQKEVYGDFSNYFATDPFHEGGDTGTMSPKDISKEVLDSMLASNPDAVWIIQSWQGNPSSELLKGLEGRREHALVLDLYAEKTPHYNEGSASNGSYGYSKEFDGTPWAFCMLNNFGGRLGLHGHLDRLASDIPAALNSSQHMIGIGITPEASYNNPVLYDFLFETIWQEDASQPLAVIDLDTWLDSYALRRYGAESASAKESWSILKDTVYNSKYNNLGQGAPESVVNARPALDIGAASTWGNAVISYDKEKLEEAASLLMEDYDLLKGSEGYQYDLATLLQQVLSNSAQEYQKKMTAAFRAKDADSFASCSETFLDIIDAMEQVTSTNEYYLLGRWVEQAKALAANADDFTKELYEFNAKALVTTWGSYNQAETGGLKDYSNRQWSGLINDFYKARWERWITARTKELAGEDYENSINWFQWEWAWARSNAASYPTQPADRNLKELGNAILEQFSAANPAADASLDIDVSKITVTAGSYEPSTSGHPAEGNPEFVLDNDPSTLWHSAYAGSTREQQYLEFALEGPTAIDGIRFKQRPSGSNGVVKKMDLLYKGEGDTAWKPILENQSLSQDAAWQKISFSKVTAVAVKLQVKDASDDGGGTLFASAAEVRFTSAETEKQKLAEELNAALEEAKAVKEEDYTAESYQELKKAIDDGKALLDNLDTAAVSALKEAIAAIEEAIDQLEEKPDTPNKTELDAAVKEAREVQNDGYTKESWEAFQNALKSALAVQENKDATQEQIDQALEALENAQDALEKEPENADKTALKAAVAEAEKLVEDQYTEKSWAVFEAALEEAKEALKDDSATAEETAQALLNLQKAQEQLSKKEVPGDQDPDEDQKPGGDQDPDEDQKPGGDQDPDKDHGSIGDNTDTKEILNAVQNAAPGQTIQVPVSTTDTSLKKDVLEEAKGKDVLLQFTLANGVVWEIKGTDIQEAKELDLSVLWNTNNIPDSVLGQVKADKTEKFQFILKYDGDFGTSVNLLLPIGKAAAGKTVSLYYYNKTSGALEYMESVKVNEEGIAAVKLTHASEYVAYVSGTSVSPAPDNTDKPGSAETTDTAAPKTGDNSASAFYLLLLGAAILVLMSAKKRQQQ